MSLVTLEISGLVSNRPLNKEPDDSSLDGNDTFNGLSHLSTVSSNMQSLSETQRVKFYNRKIPVISFSTPSTTRFGLPLIFTREIQQQIDFVTEYRCLPMSKKEKRDSLILLIFAFTIGLPLTAVLLLSAYFLNYQLIERLQLFFSEYRQGFSVYIRNSIVSSEETKVFYDWIYNNTEAQKIGEIPKDFIVFKGGVQRYQRYYYHLAFELFKTVKEKEKSLQEKNYCEFEYYNTAFDLTNLYLKFFENGVLINENTFKRILTNFLCLLIQTDVKKEFLGFFAGLIDSFNGDCNQAKGIFLMLENEEVFNRFCQLASIDSSVLMATPFFCKKLMNALEDARMWEAFIHDLQNPTAEEGETA